MPVNLQCDGHLSLQGQEVGFAMTESCPEDQERKFSPLDVSLSPFSPNEDALYKTVRRIKLGMGPPAPGPEAARRPAVDFIGQSSKKPTAWLAPNSVPFSIRGYLILSSTLKVTVLTRVNAQACLFRALD